jgi:hypothetical protein
VHALLLLLMLLLLLVLLLVKWIFSWSRALWYGALMTLHVLVY